MAAARDAVASITQAGGATITLSITIAAGATLLIVEVAGKGVSTNSSGFGVTSITAGGVAMTRKYTAPDYNTSGANVEAYELVSPPTGVVSIVATRAASGSQPVTLVAKSYTGTDLTTPTSGWTRQSNNSTSTSPYTATVAIPTTSGDITESILDADANFTAATTSAGFQTEDATKTDSDSQEIRAGYAAGAGTSVTHSYDLTANASGRTSRILWTNVKAAAGGGGGGTDYSDKLSFPLSYTL